MKRGNADHYYRSVRVGKKVKRIYVGCGETAHLAAAIDAHRRLRRQMEREERVNERRNWETASVLLDELIAVSDILTEATLLTAGYHRHHQGPWRRRRGRQQ